MVTNYSYEVIPDETGGFFGHHPDLEGCFAQGETVEETIKALDDARELWLEVRHEDGLSIPEPRRFDDYEEYSGRVSLRMPRRLHANLARAAEQEGISLNQLLNNVLAEYTGRATVNGRVEPLLKEIKTLLGELAERRATSSPTATRVSWEEASSIHRAAVNLFRNGEHGDAQDLLETLPDRKKSAFMLGLLHLAQERVQGLRLASAAYKLGLTDEEATTVLLCIPAGPRPSALKRALLPLSHHIGHPGAANEATDARDLERALLRLAAWIERERENHERAMKLFEEAPEDTED